MSIGVLEVFVKEEIVIFPFALKLQFCKPLSPAIIDFDISMDPPLQGAVLQENVPSLFLV